MNEYLSVTEFSKLHSIDGAHIRRLIAAGRLPAVKIGHQWAIPKETPAPDDKRFKTGKYINWRNKYRSEV